MGVRKAEDGEHVCCGCGQPWAAEAGVVEMGPLDVARGMEEVEASGFGSGLEFKPSKAVVHLCVGCAYSAMVKLGIVTFAGAEDLFNLARANEMLVRQYEDSCQSLAHQESERGALVKRARRAESLADDFEEIGRKLAAAVSAHRRGEVSPLYPLADQMQELLEGLAAYRKAYREASPVYPTVKETQQLVDGLAAYRTARRKKDGVDP